MDAKKYNYLRIFQIVQKSGPISRKDIEKITGLSWGSVYAICDELLKRGLFSSYKDSSINGRPPEMLIIHPEHKLSLGIDINSIGLSFNLIDLAGKTVFSAFLSTPDKKRESLLRLLEKQTTEILRQFPDTIAINLSMQGKIDKKTGVSIRTNFFEDWKNVPLVDFFTEQFHLPTMLYHDPDCLLTYHLHTDERLKGYQNGAIVRVDDGIGFAQLTGGRLYEPDENEACELGHTIVVPNGKSCLCGKQGCLESYSSLRGMKQQFSINGNTEDFSLAVKRGDKRAIEIYNQAAFCFGISLSNLFALSVPSFILLDGLAFSIFPDFFEKIKAETERIYGAPCNLLPAIHQKEAPAIGASILTIEKQIENILFE